MSSSFERLTATTTSSGAPSSETLRSWSEKLVGKKYLEGEQGAADENGFTHASLPKPSRVCKPGGLFTMDYNTERLNVHVDDNNVVTHVTMG